MAVQVDTDTTERLVQDPDDYFYAWQGTTNYRYKLTVLLGYTPANPGDWGSPEPTTIQEALDVLAASVASATIADGDKGDIVVSSGGTVWSLDSSINLVGKQLNNGTWDNPLIQNGVINDCAIDTVNTVDVQDLTFAIHDESDATKTLKFQVSGIATGTTRTLTAPNASGTIALTSDLSSGYQPLDSDLTTIAGLTATTDNFMQAKSSAWASRTPAQVATDLAVAGLQTRAPSIQSVVSAATVTPTFSDDMVKITAQAAALALANPTGTAIPGLGMVIRIKDNGTARAISYDSQYRAIGITLPTSTVISKTTYLAMIYNSDDTKWDVIATGTEA